MLGKNWTKEFEQALDRANRAPWNQVALQHARLLKLPMLATTLHSLSFLGSMLEKHPEKLEISNEYLGLADQAVAEAMWLNAEIVERVNERIGQLVPQGPSTPESYAREFALNLIQPLLVDQIKYGPHMR
jgi:hypothetical protein